MKNLIFTLMMLMSFNTFSQLAPPPAKINLNLPVQSYNNTNTRFVRPAMLIGGTSLIVAGVLAQPNMVGGSTTEKKPLRYQMHKVLPITSGVIILMASVTIPL